MIEITIALGLLSFSVVALLGLLAGGLINNRQSIDRTIEVQIMDWARSYVKTLSGGLNSTNLANGHLAGFDSFGIIIDGSTTSPHFTANIAPTDIALPGASTRLQGWAVTLRCPVRGNQPLGTNVFWTQK